MSGRVIHSLWTVMPLYAVLAGAVVALGAARGRRSVRRRIASLFGRREAEISGWAGILLRLRTERLPGIRRWLPMVGAAAAGPILVGGAVGWGLGLAAVYGMWRFRSRASGAGDGSGGASAAVLAGAAVAPASASAGPALADAEVEKQLPLAADLLAACLAAGAGPREAAEAVGASLGGPVGERLAQAAAEVRLGGDPATAWSRVGNLPQARSLASCLERAQATGVPAVEPMSRLAGRLRAERSRAAGIRARRAGVLVTAPLGLCFLPAFLTVGVAPVVFGLASMLLKGN
ncbi:type II secretion system F family protein [Streptomyces sp. NPDC020799]|uniref:type II secretion system F family protein n=1 Tax=Streptomyces sp. NPDC020799 TaxID=3365091 RepID=UPI00379AF56E